MTDSNLPLPSIPETEHINIYSAKDTLTKDTFSSLVYPDYERIESALNESIAILEKGYPNCCEDCQELLRDVISENGLRSTAVPKRLIVGETGQISNVRYRARII